MAVDTQASADTAQPAHAGCAEQAAQDDPAAPEAVEEAPAFGRGFFLFALKVYTAGMKKMIAVVAALVAVAVASPASAAPVPRKPTCVSLPMPKLTNLAPYDALTVLDIYGFKYVDYSPAIDYRFRQKVAWQVPDVGVPTTTCKPVSFLIVIDLG